MFHEARNQRALPFREERKRGVQMSYHVRTPQPKPVRDEDFPSQSSYHVSRFRVALLLAVLLGVTLSMTASLIFLFSGIPVRLQIPVIPFPSSLSLIGLACVGGGVCVLLGILLVSILTHRPGGVSPQKHGSLPTKGLFTTGDWPVLPPEPSDRQANGLFSSWGLAAEWEMQPRRQTEQLETLHMRQRLRTLQLHYVDDFMQEDDQKAYDQIGKANGRMSAQRNTDALL